MFERALQFRAHRIFQIDAVRRYRRVEVLVINRVDLLRLDQVKNSPVDHLFETRIVLGFDDPVRG